jgi:hypothetical protein
MMPALHKTNKPCFTLLTFFNATNFLFFGFTRPGIKTMIYGTPVLRPMGVATLF